MALNALAILTPVHYDAIRAAVDPSLSGDAATFPDALIESDPFGPSAEAEVLAREAQVLPSQINVSMQTQHQELAVIYLTAARLAQRFPLILSQRLGDSQVTRAPFNPTHRHASLRTLAERELQTYLGGGTGYPIVTQAFWLAKGRRGR